jgi:signal transduction histidine kinase
MSAPADPPSPGRTTHFAVVALTVVVFGSAVALVTFQLRAGLREQILRREADFLAAVAAMEVDEATPRGVSLEEAPGAVYVAVLKAQRLAGVSGLRIYDVGGRGSNTWLLSTPSAAPPASIWARVAQGESVGRLRTRLSPDETADLPADVGSDGVFEAWVPLRRRDSTALLGVAQFVVDGAQLATELAGHERRIWEKSLAAWLAGSLVIVLALGWAFRRVEAANRALRARTEDLQRANRELVLAAKTSALGTVTAHLMHELKNPLAGLELIVAGHGAQVADTGGELAAASEFTRRLRTMVNDVVGVLRDEESGTHFELTCADVAEVVREKLAADYAARGVTLAIQASSVAALAGRRANLAILVLRNLLQNAAEASTRGATVRLTGEPASGGQVEFRVDDRAGGLPGRVRERLFQPCASTKVGGSGLGLALSHQLAQQAGGRLELVRSDGAGTCFRLVLPAEA